MRNKLLVLALLMTAVVFPLAGDAWYGDVPSYYHRRIIDTITTVQKKVRDLNGDGKVNCIDHAALFKAEWDKAYPESKTDCRIVRNKRGSTMHHLFIQIYYSDFNFVLVEPWASNPSKYKMEDNWDSRYDPKYNIYGETSLWLSECHLYKKGDDGIMLTSRR